jgi:hypothetical protein
MCLDVKVVVSVWSMDCVGGICGGRQHVGEVVLGIDGPGWQKVLTEGQLHQDLRQWKLDMRS